MSDHEIETKELLLKIQQQLIFLERKVDSLLQKTQQKPYIRAPNAPTNTFRPYNKPDRPYQGNNPGYGQNRGQGPSQNYPRKRKPYMGPSKTP